MAYAKLELVKDIQTWLSDKKILEAARRFLGGGFKESQLLNWRRGDREVPLALLEGAALYHCSRRGNVDAFAAEKTGLVAESCWQVFVVSEKKEPIKPKSGEVGKHDCLTYRYWSNVKRVSTDGKVRYLTHKTWFTGHPEAKADIPDLVPEHPHEKLHFEGKNERTNDHDLTLTWSFDDSSPKDVGYRVNLKGTLNDRPTQGQRHEYLGGMTIVPVETLYIVASVPRTLLRKAEGLLDDSEFKKPEGLHFLAGGLPIDTLEDFLLSPREQKKLLAPWLEYLGLSSEWARSELTLPEPIQRQMIDDEIEFDSPRYESFILRVSSPAPYLTYALVFELQEPA